MIILRTSVIWGALLLSGCALFQPPPTKYVATSKPFTRAVAPICIDNADVLTESTSQAIEGDNRALRAINKSSDECPKDPKAKAKPTS